MALRPYPTSLPDEVIADLIAILTRKASLTDPHFLHVAEDTIAYALGKFYPDPVAPVVMSATVVHPALQAAGFLNWAAIIKVLLELLAALPFLQPTP